jgi:tetratricopeptide (TPR) repeat protein
MRMACFIIIVGMLMVSQRSYALTAQLNESYAMDLNDSMKYLEGEVERNPNNPRLRFVLASLYFELGEPKHEGAEEELTQYSPELLDKAKKEFEEVLKINKEESLAYYYLGHLSILREANIKEAINNYQKAIDIDKHFLKPYRILAPLYLSQKQYQKAASLLEGAKQLFNDATIYHQLAVAYLSMEKYDKVIEYEKKALSIQKDVNSQIVLASAYSITKNYRNARLQLENILSADPKNKTALLGLSIVFSKTGEKDKAMKTMRKAVEYYPDDPEVKATLKEVDTEGVEQH